MKKKEVYYVCVSERHTYIYIYIYMCVCVCVSVDRMVDGTLTLRARPY